MRKLILADLICLLLIAGGLVMVSDSSAGEASAPTPGFLAAALKAQQAAGSIEVKYTLATEGIESPAIEWHYVRTADALYLSVDDPRGHKYSCSFDRTRREYRELAESAGGSKTGFVSGELGGMLAIQAPFDPILRPLPGPAPECSIIDGVERGTVLETQAEVDGHLCWQVVAPGNDIVAQSVIYLDPDIGCCPRRVQMEYLGESRKAKVVDFLQYQEVHAGVWFPTVIRTRYHVPDTGGEGQDPRLVGNLVNVEEAQEISVGKAFSQQELMIEFPSGTEVRDEVLDAEYVVP